MRFILFILFTTSLWGSDLSKLKRKEVVSMTTSVIVPCTPNHFIHIEALLQSYARQTVLPDELIIAVSEAGLVLPHLISSIEEIEWPFSVKIIKNSSKCSAGKNRNIGCAHSTGDIILCQDADDIPHPQRVEIVKWLFESYSIHHLIHLFTFTESDFTFCEKQRLKIDICHTYAQMSSVRETTQGNISFTRDVFDHVQWIDRFNNGEDKQFNHKVYSLFPGKIVVHAPLLLYRNSLSSFVHE